MTRLALFTAALAGVLAAAPARADVEVAPPPREVRPDGSRDPAPAAAEPARPENPAETVDRIIKNSKTVGDNLAMTDTGTETRARQDKILKDIDSLLNPPPQSGGSSNDKNDQKDKDNKNDDKSSSGKGGNGSKGKSDMPPPMGGSSADGGGGTQQANTGDRRPRKGGGRPNDPGKGPAGGKKPDEGMAKAEPKPGKDPAGGKPSDQAKAGGGGGNPTEKAAVKPSLPLDDDVVKEVWGHLPDKLRQQVTQYYKEQFMPRYSDLLKQYYSSLANTPQKPGGSR